MRFTLALAMLLAGSVEAQQMPEPQALSAEANFSGKIAKIDKNYQYYKNAKAEPQNVKGRYGYKRSYRSGRNYRSARYSGYRGSHGRYSYRSYGHYRGHYAYQPYHYTPPKELRNVTKEEIWEDIKDLEGPAEDLLEELEDYQRDQHENMEAIADRLEEAYVKLDTPKHRAQLQAIKTRWDKLQIYEYKEEAAIHTELEKFVFQPDVAAELDDFEHDVLIEFNEICDRFSAFKKQVAVILNADVLPKLEEIAHKMEALDRKMQQRRIVYDPETTMWKISMDNDDSDQLKKDMAEIDGDINKFVMGHQEVHNEMENLVKDLTKEMQDITAELHEFEMVINEPKYKEELEVIVHKMEALDKKFKESLKYEE